MPTMSDDLALAVTQLPGWRWLPGMRWLLFQDDVLLASGRVVEGMTAVPDGALPDLDDDATGGPLLRMLHAVSDVADLFWVEEDGVRRWEVYYRAADGTIRNCAAPTLAYACAAAFAAIGRCA